MRGHSEEAGGGASLHILLAEDGSPEASRYAALGRDGCAPCSDASQTCDAHLGTDPVKAFSFWRESHFLTVSWQVSLDHRARGLPSTPGVVVGGAL